MIASLVSTTAFSMPKMLIKIAFRMKMIKSSIKWMRNAVEIFK